jgi:hypothetical protein
MVLSPTERFAWWHLAGAHAGGSSILRRRRAWQRRNLLPVPATALYTAFAINTSTIRCAAPETAVAIRAHPLLLELAFRRLLC